MLFRRHVRIVLGLLFVTLAVVGCDEPRHDPPAYLGDIFSVEALRARFNADEDHPRVILLLSPT